MPILTIFAGVNGSGKSTLYRILKDQYEYPNYINADDIARLIGDPNRTRVQLETAKVVGEIIKTNLNGKNDFSIETTFSGHDVEKLIVKAKGLGYQIHVHYLYVDKELSKERIKIRVQMHGHDVDVRDIEARYDWSIKNFVNCFDLCDHVYVYDNTGSKICLVAMKNEKCVVFQEDCGNYIKNKIIERIGVCYEQF